MTLGERCAGAILHVHYLTSEKEFILEKASFCSKDRGVVTYD